MLSVFVLRLAMGALFALLLLSSRQVAARFYRSQFLVALGLICVALVFHWSDAGSRLRILLSVSLVLAFLGSIQWSLHRAPGGYLTILASVILLGWSLWLMPTDSPISPWWLRVNDWTAAMVLGLGLASMLLGHSYLVATSMSIEPLLRLLIGFFVALILRAIFAGVVLGLYSSKLSQASLTSITILWLPVRWLLGIVIPAVLGWMAWQSARIRSTQSATGILYVLVILCFLGELTGQLLLSETGRPL